MPLAQEAAQAPGNASNVIKIVLETLRRLEREHAGSSRFEPINNEAAGNDHSIEANGDGAKAQRKSLSVGRWDRGMRRPTNTPEMKPVAGPNPVRASRQNGPRRTLRGPFLVRGRLWNSRFADESGIALERSRAQSSIADFPVTAAWSTVHVLYTPGVRYVYCEGAHQYRN